MNKKLKIGFLGGGTNSAIGRVHEIACRMDHRFDFQAGCFSRHVDVNKKSGEAYGIDPSRIYTSLSEMITKEKNVLDAIAVLTPPDQHAKQIIEVLDAGLAVICEKPLATSNTEAEEIRTVLKRTNGFLGITYNYLAYPMMRELADMITAGKLGKICQIQLEMPQEGFMRLRKDNKKPFVPQEWRLHDYGVSTVSLDLGSHLHMFVNFLTGEQPIKVAAMGGSTGNFENLNDFGMCLAKYTNDISVGVWFTKTALGFRNGLRVRIYGTEGSAEWVQENPEVLNMADRLGQHYKFDRAHPDARIANQDRYTRFKAGHPAGFIEAFANCYSDLADAITAHKEGKAYTSNYVTGIDAAQEGLRFLEAIADATENEHWSGMR